MTLAADGDRDAVFDLAEPSLAEYASSTPFSITLLSNPAIKTQGHFRDISPQADPQTRTWRLRVMLPQPPVAIALGSTVVGPFPVKPNRLSPCPLALSRVQVIVPPFLW